MSFKTKTITAQNIKLSAASFPSLSETFCSGPSANNSGQNANNESYLSKVKKEVVVEKDAVLPGYVQINFDKTNKMVYTYGSSLFNNVTAKKEDDIINVYAAFNALSALHEKRKALYIDTWGLDTYESVFGNYVIMEEEEEDEDENSDLEKE